VPNLRYLSGRGSLGLRQMSRFDLVIFDCDGVLVDSERLAVRTEADILSELGWPLTEADIIERFVGRSASYMQGEIERHIGRPLDWEIEFEPHYREVFEKELIPVEGVIQALDKITVPTCVASSSSHDKLHFSLELTDLLDRFAGRIFSSDDVEHGKPAPDLFLHAAEQLGALPGRCAVVEDSLSGVQAGIAANMSVFAYAGGVTPASKLVLDGVVVFDEMRALPELLGAG
jgi:HAD superfamily hydrolase (TIGR01509 family)